MRSEGPSYEVHFPQENELRKSHRNYWLRHTFVSQDKYGSRNVVIQRHIFCAMAKLNLSSIDVYFRQLVAAIQCRHVLLLAVQPCRVPFELRQRAFGELPESEFYFLNSAISATQET